MPSWSDRPLRIQTLLLADAILFFGQKRMTRKSRKQAIEALFAAMMTLLVVRRPPLKWVENAEERPLFVCLFSGGANIPTPYIYCARLWCMNGKVPPPSSWSLITTQGASITRSHVISLTHDAAVIMQSYSSSSSSSWSPHRCPAMGTFRCRCYCCCYKVVPCCRCCHGR